MTTKDIKKLFFRKWYEKEKEAYRMECIELSMRLSQEKATLKAEAMDYRRRASVLDSEAERYEQAQRNIKWVFNSDLLTADKGVDGGKV